MASRKFFSGLPEKMMTRSTGPNRQQTNFYWPDESNSDDPRVARTNRLRNRSVSTASIVSQASTDTEESRRRRSREMKSRIEFYDMVDTPTDTESVFSRKLDPTKHKKLETLKSRIEFYDYVDTRQGSSQMNDDDVNSVIEVVQKNENNQEVRNDKNGTIDTPIENKNYMSNSKHIDELANNVNKLSMNTEQPQAQKVDMNNHKSSKYIDSFSESDDDDEDYRYQKAFRGQHEAIDRNYPQRYRRPPLPKQQSSHQYQQSRPRRYNSHYFDDYDEDGYDRYYDNASIRSSRARLPRMPRRNYSPDISDEEFYEPRMYSRRNGRMSRDYRNYEAYSPEREYSRGPNSRYDDYYESYRDDRRQMNNRNTNMNGYGSEMEFNRPKSRTPPRQQPQQHQQQSQQQISTNEIESEQKIQSTSARPPIKPVTRSMSINEARRRHHVNLKSNIFHMDNEYNQVVEQRKPLSVRDFAANHRIGVGLPDLQ